MKFGVARLETGSAVVTALGDRWINLSEAWRDYNRHVEGRETPPLASVQDLLDHGLFHRAFYRRIAEFCQRHGRNDLYTVAGPPRFMLPWRPGKVVAIARNYQAHVRELGHEMPSEPMFFGKVPSVCIGPEDPIIARSEYGRVDHEGEIGVIIGRRASRLRPEEARDVVAGYTLVNDVTARAIQKQDREAGNPWFRAKNMDSFCPMGPVALLAEAFPWPLEVPIETRVNGELRQQGNTRQFIFDLPTLLAAVTRCITLEPGDVLATGTPEGVGPLHPGDVVEVIQPEIGTLRNPVVGD
jgi:2-keto-4-pentenoate hydratase/2-oxohepta-3-ene-1,7-dioic acid hydratase in catechol pathway